LAIAGCSDSLDRPIHFVLPDGFTGPFIIVSDSKYPDRIRKLNDRYELSIPTSAILRTNNTDIFNRWHKKSASYRSSQPFPTDAHGNLLFFSGPTGTKNNTRYISWYYVGPYDEFQAFMYKDIYQKEAMRWLEARDLSY
jgi:hypothetical protein